MDIKCYKCGVENWLENQSRCLACNAVLRRCADCALYDSSHERCRTTGVEVDHYEAANPSVLSISANCIGYRFAQRVSNK